MGVICICIADPAGAIGVESKWHPPSISVQVESLGFCQNGCTMFMLRLALLRSRHQEVVGNPWRRETVVDFNHDLIVSTACSAGAQYLPGAVYGMFMFCSIMNSSTSDGVSLSILCRVGLNRWDSHHLYTF